MNEHDFISEIRRYLNFGANAIERSTAEKLFRARQTALARQRQAASGLRVAGTGNFSFGLPLPGLLAVLAIVLLLVGLYGASVWHEFQRAAEFEEIDSALLADDLPIGAYLDRGFHAWLEQQSSQ